MHTDAMASPARSAPAKGHADEGAVPVESPPAPKARTGFKVGGRRTRSSPTSKSSPFSASVVATTKHATKGIVVRGPPPTLCKAAQQGDAAQVLALLEAGADINKALHDGRTPLFMAAEQGHEAAVLALVRAGAELDLARYDGFTAFFAAVHHGHIAVV